MSESRSEDYIKYALNQISEIPEPQSRIDFLLKELVETINNRRRVRYDHRYSTKGGVRVVLWSVVMETEKDYQEIRERLIKIETLLENYNKNTDLKLNLLQEKIFDLNHRIDDLEDNNKWLWRTFVGAIITGLVAIGLNFI